MEGENRGLKYIPLASLLLIVISTLLVVVSGLTFLNNPLTNGIYIFWMVISVLFMVVWC